MPVAPISAEAVAIAQTKNLIASCATFIAATNSVDFTAAKNSVYILETLPASGIYKRPFALILLPIFIEGVNKPAIPSGDISVVLEIDAVAGDSSEDAYYRAANFFGGCKSDATQLGTTIKGVVNDAALRFKQIVQIGNYLRSRDSEDEVGFWQCRWTIQL